MSDTIVSVYLILFRQLIYRIVSQMHILVLYVFSSWCLKRLCRKSRHPMLIPVNNQRVNAFQKHVDS